MAELKLDKWGGIFPTGYYLSDSTVASDKPSNLSNMAPCTKCCVSGEDSRGVLLSLTSLSSLHGYTWGFWVLECCTKVNILPFHAQTCPWPGSRLTFQMSFSQLPSARVCYVTQHWRLWMRTKPVDFDSKVMIKHSRALEGRNSGASSLSMPKLSLAEAPDQSSILPLVPWVLSCIKAQEVFHWSLTFLSSLHEYSWGLWVLGCCRNINSMPFHAQMCPHVGLIKINLSNELQLDNISQGFAMLRSTQGFGYVLNHLISMFKQW